MSQIKARYAINENTIALLPAKQIAFDTLVIETNQIVKVRKTPLEIIKAACINTWCTYEGRRQAVMHHTNFKKKIPIPIDIHEGIYLFPTHSTTNIQNRWIAFQHIKTIQKNRNDQTKTDIIFYNEVKIPINVSFHIVNKQMQRTFECKYRMERALANGEAKRFVAN